ncbi:MAG: MIP/aquaporin family protein [Thermoplasmata archaeon]
MNRQLGVRWAAEAAGTAVLVGVGTGAVGAATKFGGVAQAWMATAGFLAVLIPILLFVEVSGAHLNPAVTLALAASGRIAWAEVPSYWLGQLSGAFVGSACVLALLGDVGYRGATVPTNGQLGLAFGGEAVFTASLVSAVFLLADQGVGRLRWRLLLPPLAVGVATYLIGPLTGSSLNPARTIAPAVFSGTFTDLWVYLVALPLGALVVALLWRPRSVDRADRGPGRTDASS